MSVMQGGSIVFFLQRVTSKQDAFVVLHTDDSSLRTGHILLSTDFTCCERIFVKNGETREVKNQQAGDMLLHTAKLVHGTQGHRDSIFLCDTSCLHDLLEPLMQQLVFYEQIVKDVASFSEELGCLARVWNMPGQKDRVVAFF